MRLKQEAQNTNENEEEGDKVCCPVCTHYLRKDVSLHDHLNTHPKQQVIEALIQLKDACKGFGPSASAQSKGSSSGSSSSSVNTNDSSGMVVTSASSTDEPEERAETRNVEESTSTAHSSLPSAVPSTSGSHIVQYPQFLAGSSSVPPFIHVPVVTSSDPNSVSPCPSQAPVMLYNPFVCPPGPSGQIHIPSSGPLSPTQHLQFIASNSFIRTPFSIVQTRPNVGLSHVSSLVTSLVGAKRAGPSSCVAVMPLSQTATDCDEDSNGIQSSDSDVESIPCIDPLAEIDSDGEDCLPEDLAVHLKPKYSSSEESRIIKDCPPLEHETDLEHNSLREDDDVGEHEHSLQLERELLSPPKKRRCSEWNSIGSPGSHSTCSVEGVLRVRSDLSVSPVIPPRAEDHVDVCQDLSKESMKKSMKHTSNCAADAESCLSGDEDRTTGTCANIVGNFSNVSDTAHRHSSSHLSITILNRAEIDICDEDVKRNKIFEGEGHSIFSLNPDHAEFVLPCEDPREDLSPGRPGSPPCDSGPPSPYQKSVDYLDSPATPLNIQTDETMPPRGELSEQESIGGNSSSMWSVPAYHTSRELPSPVVSYDLTARESWPGSDISDSEGNANLVPDSHLPQQFSTTPSFSNTLHSFIPKNASNNSFVGESPFSSHLQPQTSVEGHSSTKNSCSSSTGSMAMSSKTAAKKSTSENAPTPRVRKAPSKPRVYRCKDCSTAFATLKLRRLHPCEQMRNSNDNTSATSVSLTSDAKVVNEDNQIPGSSRDELSTQPKPKKKYQRKPKATIKREVIVEDQSSGQASFRAQFPVGKTEPDDSTESRINTQTSSDTTASVPHQNLSLEAAGANMSYVEVTLKNESPQPVFGYQCQKCSQTFTTAKLMFQHLSSKHKGQKYQCATCGESFEKERGYLDHLMIHPLECQLCGKTFKRRKSLNLHMKWHMDVKPHKCETCSKSFVTKQKLDEHMNTHTGNAPIKCNVCEETFKRYSNLIQHRNRHHLNLKRKTRDFICHCGEVYQSKKKLEWHKEIHDNKPKSCQYCSEKFVHTVSLTRHIRKAHDRRYVPKKGRESENIECPVCHLVFLKSSLATHIKIHSGERPYSCHICGKDFSTKWNLQLHRWTHASRSSKPFKCTLCKAAFFRKQEYQGHMHSHRNVRPFTCNHCGCQFIRKYNCLRHMREHEEGKNFTCTICNKTFHRSYYLKDHMRVHSGARPFSCHICGKASTSKSNHNKHVRIHHAREPQNTEV